MTTTKGVRAEMFVGGVAVVEVRTATKPGGQTMAPQLRAADDGDAPFVELVAVTHDDDFDRSAYDVIVRSTMQSSSQEARLGFREFGVGERPGIT